MDYSENRHVLVVDDEEPIRNLLQIIISSAGYQCAVAPNGDEALKKMSQTAVDVVITDMKMPGLNGLELIRKIKARHEVDIIVMTAYSGDHTYEEIIANGASDFIEKPMNTNEMVIRLKRVLKERALLQEKNLVNKKLEAAHNELKESYIDTIQRLVLAAEYRDEDTGDHIVRMSRYSELLARKIDLPEDEVESIMYASPMHDVGKIGISDNILMKPENLTREEFEIMKTHTTIGGDILANSKSAILRFASVIALSHHEKWDGSGYPHGLVGEKIPICGRIVGLSDVFDALTSNRPYKTPYPVEVAIDIMEKEREKHFDPEMFDVFRNNIERFIAIKYEVGNPEDVNLSEFTMSARDRIVQVS